MPAPQFLPIPHNIHALACETINRRAGPLPLERDGVMVTEGLVAVAMECLNAEVLRTLPLKTVHKNGRMVQGLPDCLAARLGGEQEAAAQAVAGVLTGAGLAETADVNDAATHTQIRGVRLLSAWTWHIASAEPAALPVSGSSGGPDDAWLARCPVCRTGILNRVEGKRLFGIPPTDYYLDCSHCGGKFVPEKNRFRLVSIAHISDPRWRQLLSSVKTSDDWALLAAQEISRKPAPAQKVRTSGYRVRAPAPEARVTPPVVHRPVRPAREIEGVPVSFASLRDGTLAVPTANRTLYFRPAALSFQKGLRREIFTQSKRTVQEALDGPEFAEVKSEHGQELAKYGGSRLGQVLSDLRLRSNPVYRRFLNAYGEEDFSTFSLENVDAGHEKGVMLVLAERRLCLVLGCHSTFLDCIDRRFGTLLSDACYLDGDETACRVNCTVTACRPEPVIFLHDLSDDAAIDAVVAELKTKYFPDGAMKNNDTKNPAGGGPDQAKQ